MNTACATSFDRKPIFLFMCALANGEYRCWMLHSNVLIGVVTTDLLSQPTVHDQIKIL